MSHKPLVMRDAQFYMSQLVVPTTPLERYHNVIVVLKAFGDMFQHLTTDKVLLTVRRRDRALERDAKRRGIPDPTWTDAMNREVSNLLYGPVKEWLANGKPELQLREPKTIQ